MVLCQRWRCMQAKDEALQNNCPWPHPALVDFVNSCRLKLCWLSLAESWGGTECPVPKAVLQVSGMAYFFFQDFYIQILKIQCENETIIFYKNPERTAPSIKKRFSLVTFQPIASRLHWAASRDVGPQLTKHPYRYRLQPQWARLGLTQKHKHTPCPSASPGSWFRNLPFLKTNPMRM